MIEIQTIGCYCLFRGLLNKFEPSNITGFERPLGSLPTSRFRFGSTGRIRLKSPVGQRRPRLLEVGINTFVCEVKISIFQGVPIERAVVETALKKNLFFLTFSHSTRLLAATTLRNVLGTKNLAEILSERETISQVMQNALDEATDPWGVKAERVEM